MDTDSEDKPPKDDATASDRRPARIAVAVKDEAARARFQSLLREAGLDHELLDPADHPLEQGGKAPPDADFVIIHGSEVRPDDLQLMDTYSDDESTPALVVLREQEAGDNADRTRLLAAGARGVVDTGSQQDLLRDTLEALGEAPADAAAPHSGRVDPEPALADFHSRSPLMRTFLEFVQRVAENESSLLITGETGVGKERLAQAVHNESRRRSGPFVSINCGAIPEQLLESELFGHEAGAFTGANRQRKGRFELADGGTIFLDEIGEMPAHLQVNLLTVLQRRRVQRVGGETSVPVDVRVMAATNRDVDDEVAAGRFRSDLYYRLNVIHLEIPPLRERREDIPDLTGGFIRHFRETVGRQDVVGISDEALDVLMGWDWPGNVRELVNAVEHALVVCRGDHIVVDDLPGSMGGRSARSWGLKRSAGSRSASTPTTTDAAPTWHPDWLEQDLPEARRSAARAFERDYLAHRLRACGGRIKDTAAAAGISPRALYDRMRALGLRKEDYRG